MKRTNWAINGEFGKSTVAFKTVLEVFFRRGRLHSTEKKRAARIDWSLAYVGFTGGTGGATAIQEILNWNYYAVSNL